MRLFLHQNISNKKKSPELADNFMQNSKKRCSSSNLQKCTQGETYVKFKDVIDIQLFESISNKHQITVINDKPGRRASGSHVRRLWQNIIDLLKSEDSNNFGTQQLMSMLNTRDSQSSFT